MEVTLFDEFAIQLDKALPVNEHEDVVLLICSAKVNRFEGIITQEIVTFIVFFNLY